MHHGFVAYPSTEGSGIYLWTTLEDAKEWSDDEPKSVIEVDADLGRVLDIGSDELWLLREEFDALIDPLQQPHLTLWDKLNKQALINIHGHVPRDGEGWNPDATEIELTRLAQAKGYDSFHIGIQGELLLDEWYVVFDPRRVRPLRLLYK